MSENRVFRKVSLDRLASPEQLDHLLHVIRPRGWISLVALAILIGSAVVWGFEGYIPSKVAGQGILLRTGGVFEIAARAGGRITDVAVNVGDVVREGQVVARVAQPNVLNRIRQVRLALDSRRTEHRLLTTHTRQEVELQEAQIAERRRSLDASIAAAVENLAWLREKLSAQEQLLEQGRLTRQTVIETRRQIQATEERIRGHRHELAELGIQQLGMEAESSRTLQNGEYEVARTLTELEQLERELKEMTEIVSTFTGRVIEIMTEQGDVVGAGQPLLRLDRTGRTVADLEAVIYVPSAYGKRIRPGMEVRIAPASVAPEEHGFMLGTVTYVSDFPTTSRAIQRTLRNPELVTALSQGDAPYEVRADLWLDPETESGYRWTSAGGPPTEILTGTLCAGQITVARRRPIELVIPVLRERLGV
ncbi:MAG: NHLP bacteriocin system secretion protein [Chloroflexi bacterium]|nr:NHLP bacteriocin system secretion protein [Chloroflexota bacterium]